MPSTAKIDPPESSPTRPLEAPSPANLPPLPPRRWPWVVGLVVVLFAIVATASFVLLRDRERVHGPEGSPLTVIVPAGWEMAPADETADVPGSPLAVLRETDGRGLVVVSQEASLSQDLSELSRELPAELERRFPDFELTGARAIEVAAGPALSVSYARTEEGTSHTLLVVPVEDRSYTVNAVVPAGQDKAAAEVARILASFDLEASG